MDTKRCKRCGEIRALSEFYKDRSRKDGFDPYCKQCIRERADWRNPTQRQTRKECNRRLYKDSDKYRKNVLSYGKIYREENKEYFEEYRCSYFDLTKEENQYICFNFRNLQPLWAKDNNQKKNKLPENYLERIEGIESYLNS